MGFLLMSRKEYNSITYYELIQRVKSHQYARNQDRIQNESALRKIAWYQLISTADIKKSKIKGIEDIWPLDVKATKKLRKDKSNQKASEAPLWKDKNKLAEIDNVFKNIKWQPQS